jgi:hypothetical protein
VPLTKIQTEVLRLLAGQRDPQSYIAGATPLNRETARFSHDIDIFPDREDRVGEAAEADASILRAAGYEVRWLRHLPMIHTAEISRSGERTQLEWVVDSDFRFFPTSRDETYGFVLHPVDLATNKVMAAAGRRAARDIVDLLEIHEQILPLGAVIWAAVEKSPGFTPEGLIAEIRRNLHHPKNEWDSLTASDPIDPVRLLAKVRAALDEAETFVMRMPTEKAGLLFLQAGKVVQPDPERLGEYQVHAGQRRGHWPSNAEITGALWQNYRQEPKR